MAIWMVEVGKQTRLATGPALSGPQMLLPDELSIDELLGESGGFTASVSQPGIELVPKRARIRVPLEGQEVWAAGVTYLRSRDARMQESGQPDSYDLIYDAARPELFPKAGPGRAVGPNEEIGVRADSGWDVPEPELALVLDRRGEIVAYTIGNDVSSRSIEGENALYLPQAKIYTASCAIGPSLVPVDEAPPIDDMRITLQVTRAGRLTYSDKVYVSDMKRTPHELASWLYRAQDFPIGTVLLTGTAIVPDDDFTLKPADRVTIAITGLGELTNVVRLVGNP